MDNLHLKVKAHELRLLFAMAAKLVRESFEKHLEVAHVDLTGLQFGILRTLDEREHTLSELSRHLMLDPSTLVPVIDSLERKGYALRAKDPNDRRRNPITVTQAGAQILETVRKIDFADAFSAGVAQIGPNQADQLVGLLHTLLHHMPGGDEIINTLNENVTRFRDHLTSDK
jgi:DNA-binding MarR family transcriptional regulator